MKLIYKATNKVNRKSYIGQTKSTLAKRKYEHKAFARRGSRYAFHRAIRKHGFVNFEWEVLATVSLFEANAKERELIAFYKTFGPAGYNETEGGDSKFGHSELTKKKLSCKAKARWRDPKARKEQSDKRKRYLTDPQHRKEIMPDWADPKVRANHLAGVRRKLAKPVFCIETGEVFPSVNAAAKALGLSQGNISSVLSGAYKHTGGFTFRLATLA